MSHVEEDAGSRRDFLYVATGAAGAVTTGAAVWPLINQMNPSADVVALSTLQVPIDALEPGQQLRVLWQGKPVFIRRRTAEEIEAARAVDLAELPDANARSGNAPDADALDENRTLDEAGEYIVVLGVCTHLGCVPVGEQGDYDGWFCPCHGSHYDTSGRIRKGPAPQNLHIPELAFEDGVITLLAQYRA